MKMSRREMLIGTAGLTCGGACGTLLRGLWPRSPEPSATVPASVHPADLVTGLPSAQQAMQQLVDGNRRFVEGRAAHPHETLEWRASLVSEQHPYAVILGCADSRVPPEVIFDEGLGELFVVRQAGHVADDDSLGSIEYAVGHLHIPLVVVLGHQSCGAVTAALGAVLRDEPAEGHILRLVDDITPAVLESRGQPGDEVDNAIRANVRQVVRRVRVSGPILRPMERRGEVKVVGAYYNLRTGVVEWLNV